MPNYGTVAGVFELYPRVGSVSAVTSAMVFSYITRAEVRADAVVGQRFTVPVLGSPPLLKEAVETLTLGLLLRRFFSQEQENKSEWVEGFFTDANAIITAVAAGSMTLVNSAGVLITVAQPGQKIWSSTMGYHSTMDIQDPIDQRISQGRLQATIDEAIADE